MKFIIENVGPIKTATVELGQLTIVCGKNNTGKTCLTRSIYEFYRTFRNNLSFSVDIDQKTFPLDIDLAQYAKQASSAVKECAKKYSKAILDNGAKLSVSLKPSEFPVSCDAPPSQWKMGHRLFTIKKEGSVLHIDEKVIPLDSTDKQEYNKDDDDFDFQALLSAIIKHYLFEQKFNDCFIADSFCVMSERNGFVHFKTHINIANAFVANQSTNNSTPIKIKIDEEGEQLPNRKLLPLSLSLIHALSIFERETMFENRKQTEFQKQFNPMLDAIVEGKYELKEGQFFFTPNNSNNNAISMDRSSSSIESLLLLDYYVRYLSEKGDVLVIDEPEMNLHPEKQRQLARFLATLVNAGIKVFITTHSDYIIREFNTLIMLNDPKSPRLTAIAKKLGYDQDHLNCLLSSNHVRCYVASDNTVKPMDVNMKYGIEVTSFDDTISQVNQLQQTILYGAE